MDIEERLALIEKLAAQNAANIDRYSEQVERVADAMLMLTKKIIRPPEEKR